MSTERLAYEGAVALSKARAVGMDVAAVTVEANSMPLPFAEAVDLLVRRFVSQPPPVQPLQRVDVALSRHPRKGSR